RSKGKTTVFCGIFTAYYKGNNCSLAILFRRLMMRNLYDLLYYFQCGCIIFSTIISLRIVRNKKVEISMQNFYWYPLVGAFYVTILLINDWLNLISVKVVDVAVNVSIIFHFVFFGVFIKNLIKCPRIQKYLAIAFYL